MLNKNAWEGGNQDLKFFHDQSGFQRNFSKIAILKLYYLSYLLQHSSYLMTSSTFPKICLPILSIFISITVAAQDVVRHISGQVVDEMLQPISQATVSLHNLDQKTVLVVTTDSAGIFKLKYAIAGKYTIKIRFMGYNEYQSTVFELADTHFNPIKLSAQDNTLKGVEIISKEKTIEMSGGTIIYNVSNTIAGQGVTALEALKKAPGVYVENESNITLNGKSGVQIMLDGKQTYLSGRELIDLLKSLPSSSIRSIELMNSPTAKYDASGAAGIINIKTNKSQIMGFNGTVTTGISYGVSLKQNEDIALNYRSDKVNVYGSYSHFLGNYSYLYGTERNQNGKTYDSHTDDVDKRQKASARLGLDYSLNDKNVIGFLVNSNFIFGGGRTDTKTDITIPPSFGIDQSLDAFNDYYGQNSSRYHFNVNYKYEDTLGHILNIDADYGFFDKWNGNLQSNIYRDDQQSLISQNLYRTLNEIDINLKGVKIDYTTNLGKGKLESGLKYAAVESVNDAQFSHVKDRSDSLDNRRSNDFQFNERISSAYLNYKQAIGKWSFQAGLRLENSNSEGLLHYRENGVNQATPIKRDYTNLFPAFSASIKPIENHSFSLSYSRRIERPAYQDLNPFIYMLDELSFWQGNPFLNPELTHRLSLLYAYKSATIITLNYAYTNQFSAKVTDTLEQEKIVMVARNLGTQRNWSLALTQNVAPTVWWDATFNGMLYYIQNDISFDAYRNLNLKQLAGRMSLLQTFKLPFKTKAEITASYNSKRLSGANNFSRAISQVDLGLQKVFMKDKGTIRLALNDIYKGNQSRSTQSFPGFYSSSYGYYESRQLRLNFTYRFSDKTLKGPRVRNSALDNESGRIK